MNNYAASIRWERNGDDFARGRYSRCHKWEFDGGTVVPASPAATVIPPPLTDPAGVDPEEALVAAISSCHMLFFLDLARRSGRVVESYRDDADGELGKREDGRTAMVRVTLRPKVAWDGEAPDEASLAELHRKAHEVCFIANSVTSRVTVEH